MSLAIGGPFGRVWA